MAAVVAIQPALSRPGLHIAPAHPFTSQQQQQHQRQAVNDKENRSPSSKSPSTVSNTANLRNRRERPCDACRRRKSRCVINEGAVLCVLCEFHRQECTFLQSPQPRKRKLVESKKEAVLKKRPVDLGKGPHLPQTPNLAPAPSPALRPYLSRSSTTTTTSQTDVGETLGLHRKFSRYLGLTAPFDNVIWGLSRFDTKHESNIDIGTLRKVNENECFIMLNDEEQDYDDAETLRIIDNVIGPHSDALVDLYFKIVHPSFPIVQKKIFYSRLRNGDRTYSPPLLLGMYILALNWWSSDPRLAHLPKPDVKRLEAIASRALSAGMQRPKLSTVQGGLLLLQRPGADSWSLTTQLVAVGQELGLHLDCSTWSIPDWERGLRRRIAWALYMQDKWSSLIHGRPSHIFGANWAVRPIEDADFDAAELASSGEDEAMADDDDDLSNEAKKGKVLFAQMIALTGIMAEITDTFYTQVALQEFSNAGKGSTKLILDRAKPVQMRLKNWFSSLPKIVKMDNYVTGQLSATGFLHLAYFATEITLHRRIVQSLEPETSDNYMAYVCRSAAKTRLISAMDFINRLKPEHLQAFWHFAAKINFTLIGTFGSLLWATAPSKEEATFYKNRLQEYRWTLSVSSKRADFLEHAVRMLDASRAMLGNLADKPSVVNAQGTGVPGDTPAAAASNATSKAGSSGTAAMSEDQQMEEAAAALELRKFPSGSAFSGFSNDHLDGYGGPPGSGMGSHIRMEMRPDMT